MVIEGLLRAWKRDDAEWLAFYSMSGSGSRSHIAGALDHRLDDAHVRVHQTLSTTTLHIRASNRVVEGARTLAQTGCGNEQPVVLEAEIHTTDRREGVYLQQTRATHFFRLRGHMSLFRSVCVRLMDAVFEC